MTGVETTPSESQVRTLPEPSRPTAVDADVPGVLPLPESTYQLLLDAAATWPEAVATQWIADPGRYTECLSWTYAELAGTVTPHRERVHDPRGDPSGRGHPVRGEYRHAVRGHAGGGGGRHRGAGQPRPAPGADQRSDPADRVAGPGRRRTGAGSPTVAGDTRGRAGVRDDRRPRPAAGRRHRPLPDADGQRWTGRRHPARLPVCWWLTWTP